MKRRLLITMALVVVAISIAGFKLVTGPLYAAYTAQECTDAYAKAKSTADSARVDLHPYAPADPVTGIPDRTPRVSRDRCILVRGAKARTDSGAAARALRPRR